MLNGIERANREGEGYKEDESVETVPQSKAERRVIVIAHAPPNGDAGNVWLGGWLTDGEGVGERVQAVEELRFEDSVA